MTEIDERQEMRDLQMLYLEDDAFKNIYAASMIHKNGMYGNYDKQLGQRAYVNGLNSDSEKVKNIIGEAVKDDMAEKASQIIQQGGDIYQQPMYVHPEAIGDKTIEQYQIAVDNVFVEDILNKLNVGINDDSAIIPNEAMNQTMGEFKDTNEELYQQISGIYSQDIVQENLANSILEQRRIGRESLESRLNITQEQIDEQERMREFMQRAQNSMNQNQ